VFFVTYIISGIIMPMMYLGYLTTRVDLLQERLPSVFGQLVRDTMNTYDADTSFQRSNNVDTMTNQIDRLPEETKSSSSTQQTHKSIFNKSWLMTRPMYNLGMLVTFGLASPLLSVLIVWDTLSQLLLWRVQIRRYISIHKTYSVEAKEAAIQRIDHCCRSASARVDQGTWLVLSTIMMF